MSWLHGLIGGVIGHELGSNENVYHIQDPGLMSSSGYVASSCCSASCMQSSYVNPLLPRRSDWGPPITPKETRCEYCGGLFAKDATKCQNCGAPR